MEVTIEGQTPIKSTSPSLENENSGEIGVKEAQGNYYTSNKLLPGIAL